METEAHPPTLAEVVSALVTAWRNLAAYPAGHPARSSALAIAHARLRAALADTSPLVLGIAHDGLVSGDKKLAAAQVRAFARALYRRNGGLLRFEADVSPLELERFLTILGDSGPGRDRPITGDVLATAEVHRITVSAVDYSNLVATTDVGQPAGEEGAIWDELLEALLEGQVLGSGGGAGGVPSRDRSSANTIASLFRDGPGTGGPASGGHGGGGPGGGGLGGLGGGGPVGRGWGAVGLGSGTGSGAGGGAGSSGGTAGVGGRLGMAGAHRLAGLVGDRLASADSDEREKLAPQIIQLLRALPAEVREPVLAAALRTLATDEAAADHLARLAAALPDADVLRGLQRLAREHGQLSGHALRMAQALAEAHEEIGPAPAPVEAPADFAQMAALFREEDVDRYNPEDHRALLAQKPTVDLEAIAGHIAADPEAFGPDTESDDAIDRRLVATLLDMSASSPDIVQPVILGRLREMFVRALQVSRFAHAIGIIRAVRELAADPGQAERRGTLDEFLISLADAETLAALVAASRQPGGPPFVQVQTLILALGASAARGLLVALAAEPDRGRRLRLIELAASLGAAIVPETRRLLADPRWYVVRNMVLLLRRVQDRSAMSEILRCTDHQDLRVRLEAIRALFAFDTKVPRDLLARMIQNPDRRLAEAAVLLTGQHGITQAIPLLVEILRRWDLLGRQRALRLKALRALADIADPTVLPRLGRFFHEWPFPLAALEERRAAYRFLHSYEAAARAPWVARGQRSRDPVIRDICQGLAKATAERPA